MDGPVDNGRSVDRGGLHSKCRPIFSKNVHFRRPSTVDILHRLKYKWFLGHFGSHKNYQTKNDDF